MNMSAVMRLRRTAAAPGGATIAVPAAPDADVRGGSSYGQILKSTAMIGGSSLVNIAFSVVRMKTIAVLLGPGGVGLMSLFMSIVDLTKALAGLGLQGSGVRQIAEAAGAEDDITIARITTLLNRISIALGLAGALLLAALAVPVSVLTFGDHSHAMSIVLLSIAVFFGLVSSAQLALLQGLRRIGDLSRISMLSAMFSTLIAIVLVYLLGEQGIVPALVSIAAVSVATSWWYSSKIRIKPVSMSVREMGSDASDLLKLGVVFMASAFLTVGAAYAVRLGVLKAHGVDAAGLYQAAWSLGGLYASFILQAMGTDFYPRLTAAANDNVLCNRLVNEQARISILLAGPGLLATLAVAPVLMTVFYSPEFYPAADLLRWLCLGMMLRIVAWPMGFIILAKGARKIFFWTEVAATVVHVGLAWLLVSQVGLSGAGIAFFGLYVWHSLLIYIIVSRLSGFRWTYENIRLGLIFLPAAGLILGAFHVLAPWPAMAVGASVTLMGGLYSLRELLQVFPIKELLKGNWGRA